MCLRETVWASLTCIVGHVSTAIFPETSFLLWDATSPLLWPPPEQLIQPADCVQKQTGTVFLFPPKRFLPLPSRCPHLPRRSEGKTWRTCTQIKRRHFNSAGWKKQKTCLFASPGLVLLQEKDDGLLRVSLHQGNVSWHRKYKILWKWNLCSNLRYLYLTWVLLLLFASTPLHSEGNIVLFLLLYIYLTVLGTLQWRIFAHKTYIWCFVVS